MSLSRYELMILAAPEITQDESAHIEKQVESIVKKRNGSIISFDRWGKYRLAYPVAKNDYGVYFLARFDVEGDAKLNNDFRSMFKIKFDKVVLRNMVTALETETPLEYKRPRSLEETPDKDAGNLLKERKVEELISAVKATKKDGGKKPVEKQSESQNEKEEEKSEK